MKTVLGIWKLNNGKEVEIKWDANMLVYYAIVERDYPHASQDCLYYNDKGECYRDKRLSPKYNEDISKNESNYNSFKPWDLKELIGEEVEEKVEKIKRNSNPILMIDLCTE
jgi:hypothetical protein